MTLAQPVRESNGNQRSNSYPALTRSNGQAAHREISL
ncbi:hypothetical protein RB2654_14430 [Rhodobacterales bacterium HTCC2654]|uniref:Uncharacterized protein n=1 Tax=Maritimibacter alkaliphilus HTCC2654 TaxID=314271 RepID=A3VGT5_9RHOB|nr:hypothetical protein RB2654_14430 [Rhodobacterales bacterium HTCC2654] [Maritimibacter alkaliphilus HTCC2654]